MLDDLLNTEKMRDVRTIILAAVSRRDLCYVSENEGFRFWKKTQFRVFIGAQHYDLRYKTVPRTSGTSTEVHTTMVRIDLVKIDISYIYSSNIELVASKYGKKTTTGSAKISHYNKV